MIINSRVSREVEAGPGRLPRGRHGLPAHVVQEHQRERLIWAMVTAVAEHGYGATTVGDVLECSGVSRKTFYSIFNDKAECFLCADDALVDVLAARVTDAFVDGDEWSDQVRHGLQALLDQFAERPAETRVGIVEGLAAGPLAFERYDRALQRFVPLLDLGRAESPYGDELPANLSETVVSGIAHLLHRRVSAGETEELSHELDELLYFALAPYLGHTRATHIVRMGSAG